VYRCTNLGGTWQWRTTLGCDDGDLCTYGDACNGSDACAGTAISCADSTCIDRACNGTSSCTVTYPSGTSCSDGNLCTYGETCNGGGSCTGGSTVTCTSSTCVNRACDGDATCAETYPSGTSCDDGNPCTYNTTCNGGGSCAGGSTVTCTDTTCRDNYCDGDATCGWTAINEGASCGAGMICVAGTCTTVNPCGDGDLDAGETCDDGDTTGGDGCDSSCHVERYWVCDGAPSVCHHLNILFAVADVDDAAYRANIAAITGGAVNFYDARYGTPSLGEMQAYDCVFTRPNYTYYDPTGLGNTLASYADWGGTVVLGVFSTYSSWALGGTIMTAAYSPVYNPTNSNHYATMTYAGGGTSPIHYLVSTYSVGFADYLSLQGSGVVSGYYSGGEIAHAHRPDYRVIFSNGAGDAGLAGSGDWPRLMANACTAQYYLGY
jgi:cysteine-rich repeat protein